jgi:hypothetical protein
LIIAKGRDATIDQTLGGRLSTHRRAEMEQPVSLTSFELGKLKIAGHVREELDRAAIAVQSIHCRSDGINTPPGTARLTVTVNGTSAHLDFKADEVEDCDFIVAGETWRRIAAFISRLTGHKEP